MGITSLSIFFLNSAAPLTFKCIDTLRANMSTSLVG
jgi:hypothetical protein